MILFDAEKIIWEIKEIHENHGLKDYEKMIFDETDVIALILSAPAIDAVPVDKMELQQFSIDTQTRTAKAVFRFEDKRITLCRDCGELAPVVHGRWETNNDPEEIVKDFSCSVCEELLCDFDTYALTPGENCFYYCPNCGARMDGEMDENEKI